MDFSYARPWPCLSRLQKSLCIFVLSVGIVSLQAATPQTIIFPPIADHLVTDAPFSLAATASSGLPVSYSIVSTGISTIATVSGSTVTLAAINGAVTVRASQAGDATYEAAEAYRSFAVLANPIRHVKLAVGVHGAHYAAIRGDGTLWAWGENSSGQLGLGNTTSQPTPTKVGTASNWTSVASGSYHIAAVRADGTLWTAGSNLDGQLGDGTSVNHTALTQVGSGTTWTTVACGTSNTFALRTDGTLWAWGPNFAGQLGDGTTVSRNAPVQVGTATTWKAVTAGRNHTLALRTDGTLWAWGSNSYGQFGDGSPNGYRTSPVQLGTHAGWATIACGEYYCMATRADGTLWAWGFNGSGQLGLGTTATTSTAQQVGSDTNWAAVGCGSNHTVATRTDGSLWGWGSNSGGQVGNGRPAVNRLTPDMIAPSGEGWLAVGGGYAHSAALSSTGALWLWGDIYDNEFSSLLTSAQPSPVQVGTASWRKVAGKDHVAAIRQDGTLWTWGLNNKFQLGLGDTAPRPSPVQVGSATTWTDVACGAEHSVALRGDGSLWIWGSGITPGQGSTWLPPVAIFPDQIGHGFVWTAVACGEYHTLAVRADGTLWAWGFNTSGQLGLGNYSNQSASMPAQVGTASNWRSVACGASHSLALRADGTLWAWGANDLGQLGDGTNLQRNAPAPVGSYEDWTSITAANASSLAVRGGTLWGWGGNTEGQLGNGTPTATGIPTQAGSDSDWASVAVGDSHTLGIRTDGTLWLWGYNHGRAISGTMSKPHYLSPIRIGTDVNWASCLAGSTYSMALRSDGTFWAWGSNAERRLGIPPDLTRPVRALPAPTVQTLALPALPSLSIGQSFTLAASARSGLPITYTVAGPATLTGKVLTPTGLGAIHVVAYQHGDGIWQAAEPVVQSLAPQVVISGGGGLVGASPALENLTDFGMINLAPVTRAHTFALANTGNAGLSIAGLALSGAHAADFVLTAPLVSVLAPGESTTFQITFSPSAAGLRQAVVSLPQAGAQSAPLTFAVQGTGLAGPAQMLHFPPPHGRLTTDAPFSLQASSSSGLPITFTLVSAGNVATVSSGGVVTLTGIPGAVTIRASQAGNGSLQAAPDVYHTFSVADAALRFVHIAASVGTSWAAGVRADGTLWAWGTNASGQLGDGTTSSRNTPAQVGTATNWAAVACGNTHALALRTDGTLWSWGANTQGQLGDGTLVSTFLPAQVGTDANWAAVACGPSHSLARRTDGTLWSWGMGGRVGDGTGTRRTIPVQVGTAFNWTAIACGSVHSMALRDDGTLWSWGSNSFGQLGDSNGSIRLAPAQVASVRRWTTIACGNNHSLALSTDGEVWGWGLGSYGQLGTVTEQNTPVPSKIGGVASAAAIAGGMYHSLVLRTDGVMLTLSSPSIPNTDAVRLDGRSDWAAMACGAGLSLALDTGGVLHTWGSNASGQLGQTRPSRADASRLGTDTDWTAASAADLHTVGLRSDGTLWSWGSNDSARLGIPASTDVRLEPGLVSASPASSLPWTAVFSAPNHNLALRTDGSLWTWGSNARFQLGNYAPPVPYDTRWSTPQPVGDPAAVWLQVGGGEDYSMALRDNGTLWAFGISTYGQFGQYTSSNPSSALYVPTQIGGSSTWTALACGNRHVLLLQADGTLWSAGTNANGQLGRATPVAADIQQVGTASNWATIAAGWYHSAAVRADGTLWSWGAMDGASVTAPVPGPTRVGTAANWKAVACGQKHTAAIRSDGTLWAWGDNSNGQLGDGTSAYQAEPVQIGAATNWTSVSCGTRHTVAMRNDGTFWSWGDGRLGQPYNSDTSQPFRISPAQAPQALTFPALGSLLVGKPVTLAATTSSGLPFVAYTLAGPATLSGTVLTPTAAGTITVTAYQTGDDVWQIADSAMQTVQAHSPITQQSWRQTHFGTSSNSGSAADTADADKDGLANLVEYAFGLSPTTGSSSQLPQPQQAAGSFTVTFPQPAGVTGVTYGASYSPSLTSSSWIPIPDTGSGGNHIFSVPTTGQQQMFIRLEVTAP